MSALKLTVPLTGLLAVAVLSPALYCYYVSMTAWSVLASAVSISASLALWRGGGGGRKRAQQRLREGLPGGGAKAEETEKKLKKTISDLEEFALLAVRRELKMQELRERFVELKRDHEIKRDFP